MTRPQLRRRLLLAGLVPLLLAVALATRVAFTYHHAGTGRDALRAGDADAARTAYAANATLNVLETWVAPYNEGVAGYAQGDPEDAARLFADALRLAPTDQQCRVRTNLALALEAVGDAAVRDEVGEALRRWRGARASLDPCLEAPVADDAADAVRDALSADDVAQLTALDQRIADKLAEQTTSPTPDAAEEQPVKGRDADFSALTPAERRQVLAQRNELGRERRERERRFEEAARERREQRDRQDQPPSPDEPVYNW